MDSNEPPGHTPTPPPPPPPLIVPPPPRPAPRRSYGWMIVSIILAGLLLLTWISKLGGSATKGRAVRIDGRSMEEIVVENNRSAHKLVIVEVDGMITSMGIDRSGRSMVDLIKDQLTLAGQDDAVKAVLLKVNSPGGEVLASDDIYRAIQDFQRVSDKPVVASMNALAASGGYYVSAPCYWIVANELTITGSIGVIMASYNVRELLNKIGVRPEVYKSGKFKDMLSWSKSPEEISPEEREMVQSLIDHTYQRFKAVVGEGRAAAQQQNEGAGRPLVNNWEEFADGRILSGKQAYEFGFVDELGGFEVAVERAQMLAGISRANLIRYQRPFDLGSLFQIFGKQDNASVKLDLGLDLPNVQAGRLYFLPFTFFH